MLLAEPTGAPRGLNLYAATHFLPLKLADHSNFGIWLATRQAADHRFPPLHLWTAGAADRQAPVIGCACSNLPFHSPIGRLSKSGNRAAVEEHSRRPFPSSIALTRLKGWSRASKEARKSR